MSSFGERLRTAFNNAKNAEIARKLRVSEPAVKNYVEGRIPQLDTLIEIRNLTGRSLDWLITGEEGPVIKPQEDAMIERVREIVREELRAATVVNEIGGEVGEIEPAEFILAPVVAHIGPGASEAEDKDEIRRRLMTEQEREAAERARPRRKRTG